MSHDEYQTCIEACQACAEACDRCAVACLTEPAIEEMTRCIRLNMDCAAACRLAAGFMARDSELASTVCRLCAEICDACGMECASHKPSHCQQCAQACYRCAAECRRIAEVSYTAKPSGEAAARSQRPNA
ncbi:MAG TPA: four-helix bundle copper-binding protein [Burkholderiales bacterium]|nr:four-helix bundle copper-binding protein [Burkholderiales bacterium]